MLWSTSIDRMLRTGSSGDVRARASAPLAVSPTGPVLAEAWVRGECCGILRATEVATRGREPWSRRS